MKAIMQIGSELFANLLVDMLSVLAVLVICGVQEGIICLKQQTAQLRDDGLRATLDSALEDVGRLIETTVGSIEQTAVNVLRSAVKLGNTNRKDLATLPKRTFDETKIVVTPETQEVIVRQLSSFDDCLKKLIEDTVRKIKNKSPCLTPSNRLLGDIVIDDGKDRAAGSAM